VALEPPGSAVPAKSLLVVHDFISEAEESALSNSVYPLLKFRYQGTHWDDVIVKYREIELALEVPATRYSFVAG
jgi:hypothetical protein